VLHDGDARQQVREKRSQHGARQLPVFHHVDKQELNRLAVPLRENKVSLVNFDQVLPLISLPPEQVQKAVTNLVTLGKLRARERLQHPVAPNELVVGMHETTSRDCAAVCAQPLGQRDGRRAQPASQVDDFTVAREIPADVPFGPAGLRRSNHRMNVPAGHKLAAQRGHQPPHAVIAN
jgi:hypothetical protein